MNVGEGIRELGNRCEKKTGGKSNTVWKHYV